MDIRLNNNYDLIFTNDGDILLETNERENNLTYLSMLLEMKLGDNKQYPNLGIDLLSHLRGNYDNLLNTIISQTQLIGIEVKSVSIINEKLNIEL